MIIIFKFHSITSNDNHFHLLVAGEPEQAVVAGEPVPKNISTGAYPVGSTD